MCKKSLSFWILVGFMVCASAFVNAEVTVHDTSSNLVGTFTTIQAGVDACPTGGTVSVSAGTYTEAVYINKRIALVGIGTPKIDASNFTDTNTVTFDGNDANKSSISNFRIIGAPGTIGDNGGNGIACSNSSPIITNNTISGNGVYGITCWSSDYPTSPTIINNIILGNGDSGICCYNSSPTITNNTISENTQYGIHCTNSSPLITNNTISGNGYDGIRCYNNSSPIITNNTITGNRTGICCLDSSSPTIYNNIITTNNQYGIYNWGGNPTINYNCVWSNGYGDYSNCTQGIHDISANPQFIGGSDYHLQSTSHCINAGTNTAPGISGTSTDKDGKFRIVNGIVDMGAYEYPGIQSPTGAISGKITESDRTTPIANVLVEALQGTVTIGTATTDANGSYSINLAPGTYTVKVVKPQYLSTQTTDIIVNQGTTTSIDLILYSAKIKPIVSSSQSAGSEVLLKIQAGDENEPVEGLLTLCGTLTYAPAEDIEILQVSPGKFMGNDLQIFQIDKSTGKIQFMLRRKTSAGGVTGYGDVLAIKLKIADTASLGTVTFSLSDIQAYGTNSRWISLLPESKEMRINRVIIKPVVHSSIILSDQKFEVDIQVGDGNNYLAGLKSISFDLNWEALEIVDVLKPVSENVEPGQFLGTSAIIFATLNNGTLSICVGRSVGESSGYGTVTKVRCRVLPGVKPGTKGTFTISNVLAYGADSNQIKLTPVSCTFTIEIPGTWTQVWPGDTNNDGLADKWDIIPIAFYLCKTGAQRENTSIDWKAWTAPYWNILEPLCPDAVYSDTNGDGKVDIQDVHAIIINYGKTHSKAQGLLAKSSPGLQSQFDKYYELLKNRPDLAEKLKTVLDSLDKSYETQEMRGLLQELIESVEAPEFKVYPNPYRPTDTHKGIRGITFENLGNTWQIKIYNIAGELVEEMHGAENNYTWLMAKDLASGVYLYLINSTTLSKKTGKLAIIK